MSERQARLARKRLNLPRPHAGGQANLVCPATQIVVANCGSKFGKTAALAIYMAGQAWTRPGCYGRWIAPVYRQAKIGFELLRKIFPPEMHSANESDLRIRLANGTVIDFCSAEKPTNLEGEAMHFGAVDEAAKMKEAAWHAIVSTTMRTKGRIVLGSTPRGRNWFYEVYQQGVSDSPEFAHISSLWLPTWRNPYVDMSEVRKARATMPLREFERIYGAIFHDDIGGVFSQIDRCVARAPANSSPPIVGHSYVAGVDLGRKHDWTVVVVLDLDTGNVACVGRWQHAPWEELEGNVVDLCNAYGAHAIIDATSTGGDRIFESVSERIDGGATPFVFGPKSKPQLVQNAIVATERAEVGIPKSSKQLIAELKAFEYGVTPSGHVTYQGPDSFFDDCVDAFCLALWGARSQVLPIGGAGLVIGGRATPLRKVSRRRPTRGRLAA